MDPRNFLLELPRLIKQVLAMLVDASIALLATYVAYYLRIDSLALPVDNQQASYWCAVLFSIPIFYYFGMYRIIFRYADIDSVRMIAKAHFVYGLIYFSFFAALKLTDVPRSVGVIQPILSFIAILLLRELLKTALYLSFNKVLVEKKNILIFGVTESSISIATYLRTKKEYQLIGFVDDSKNNLGQKINGYRVWPKKNLDELLDSHSNVEVMLSTHGLGRSDRSILIDKFSQKNIRVRLIPEIADIAGGHVSIVDLKEVSIEDILDRDIVPPDGRLLQKDILNKVVMVTGAAGSIGSELVRQILPLRPKKIILLDHSEYGLYQMGNELSKNYTSESFKLVLLDIADVIGLERTLSDFPINTIYHAAAYKHVPIVESNVLAAVKNNIFGTLNLVQKSIEYHVDKFVLISTDKAVRPTNVMGATKRIAELVLQAHSHITNSHKIVFTMVRFGNVLNSSGSVVPKFRKQIAEGGPITITDKEVTRFFMTIPEAAQLVIQAGALSQGGDVYLLDMGAPVKIWDLATKMITLSGLRPKDSENFSGDIEIKEIGLRPGEKLYEELLITGDLNSTSHPKIFQANEEFMTWAMLEIKLVAMEQAIKVNDQTSLISLLQELVPGFSRQ